MAEVQTSTQSGELSQRFIEFVMMHAQNAALFLGQIPNPKTGEGEVNLELAKMFIDQLAMIQEKTRGNLTSEESTVLRNALSNLQMVLRRSFAADYGGRYATQAIFCGIETRNAQASGRALRADRRPRLKASRRRSSPRATARELNRRGHCAVEVGNRRPIRSACEFNYMRSRAKSGNGNGAKLVAEAIEAAEEAGLRYVSDDRPGYTRKAKGDDFEYFDTEGKSIRDEQRLLRIKRLANSAGLDGCLDLSQREWAHSGNRSRCAAPQTVSLSRALARSSR